MDFQGEIVTSPSFQFLWGWNLTPSPMAGATGDGLSIPLRMKLRYHRYPTAFHSTSLSIPLRMKRLTHTSLLFFTLTSFNSFEDETHLRLATRGKVNSFQFLWGWNTENVEKGQQVYLYLSIPLRMKPGLTFEGCVIYNLSIPLRMKPVYVPVPTKDAVAFNSFEDETQR